MQYFRACGIGDDAWTKFSDKRQIAAEELDVIRRIAVRCATARPWPTLPENSLARRGQGRGAPAGIQLWVRVAGGWSRSKVRWPRWNPSRT